MEIMTFITIIVCLSGSSLPYYNQIYQIYFRMSSLWTLLCDQIKEK